MSFFGRIRILVTAGTVFCALPLAAQTASTQNPTLQQLRENFLHPPDSAKPMVRWWWFGAAVTKPEILRELQQMKADGIGGAELAFVYPEVLDGPNPAGVGTGNGSVTFKNLPFLSPEHLAAITYAKDEGRKLGLRIDATLCSGWPYGGPSTPLSEAAGRLRTFEVSVPLYAGSLPLPRLSEGDEFISASIVDGDPGKWNAATSAELPLGPLIDSRTLLLTPATKDRVALFFVASHTLQQVKRAAVGAEGYVLDPFSHQAVATHLAKVGEPLVKAFGSTPPYAIFSDSLEAYGADWTPSLPAEFLKRRGYDLVPHLPELVVGGTPAAEKVRHDWGRTLTELVNENYLTQINDWAKAHGTKFRSQTYGEPAVSFSSQRLAALPEGEGPQWRAFSTLRWATSANHVFGNNVTSGETFTWLHSPVFRATPLDMKAEADIDFIMGENQLIFHGWPYSPPPSELEPGGLEPGDPGWSLYAAAVFNDHNPWHSVMPAVTQYIARISYLLRQGQPANQVAVLLPTDDAWSGFSPAHVTVTGAMQKLVPKELIAAILSAGYNFDFIDADAINSVGLGTHQILVLPPTDRIPADTLRKIIDWAAQDGKIIAVGKLPSLDAEGQPLMDKFRLAPIALVPSAEQLGQALHNAGVPDLSFPYPDVNTIRALGFLHRKLPDADIYFVTNTSNQAIDTVARLATSHKFAERWDPDSTTAYSESTYQQHIYLAPYESAAVIFSDHAPTYLLREKMEVIVVDGDPGQPGVIRSKEIADVSSDWRVTFSGLDKSLLERKLTDWITDATTQHFSGEAVYSRDFMLKKLPRGPISIEIDGGTALPGAPDSPPEHGPAPGVLDPNGLPNPLVTRPGPGMHAYFDPPIREAALVTINGQPAGALWHPPYRLDITKLLKPGANHIEIHVYNTALNAWSALPPRDYKPLIEKYGDRFQMQDLNKVAPIPSGILGTIKLVTETP
jgi:hypothetical protein